MSDTDSSIEIPTDAEFLGVIDAFCTRHALGTSIFGTLAIEDGGLVKGMRDGRSVSLLTAGKISRFMAHYEISNAETATGNPAKSSGMAEAAA